MNISERLRALRIKQGETQKQAAERTGITERAYQYYENGKQKPNIETLSALAKHFNVTTDYLLGQEEKAPAEAGAEDDTEVIASFIKLSESNKKAVLNLVDNLLSSQSQS